MKSKDKKIIINKKNLEEAKGIQGAEENFKKVTLSEKYEKIFVAMSETRRGCYFIFKGNSRNIRMDSFLMKRKIVSRKIKNIKSKLDQNNRDGK